MGVILLACQYTRPFTTRNQAGSRLRSSELQGINQTIKLPFLRSNFLIAVAGGGTGHIVVTTPCFCRVDSDSAIEMARRDARRRRTYYDTFVSIRIPSPDICAKVKKVQEAVSEKDGRLRSFHDPAEKNHVTVILLQRLNGDSELER